MLGSSSTTSSRAFVAVPLAFTGRVWTGTGCESRLPGSPGLLGPSCGRPGRSLGTAIRRRRSRGPRRGPVGHRVGFEPYVQPDRCRAHEYPRRRNVDLARCRGPSTQGGAPGLAAATRPQVGPGAAGRGRDRPRRPRGRGRRPAQEDHPLRARAAPAAGLRQGRRTAGHHRPRPQGPRRRPPRAARRPAPRGGQPRPWAPRPSHRRRPGPAGCPRPPSRAVRRGPRPALRRPRHPLRRPP